MSNAVRMPVASTGRKTLDDGARRSPLPLELLLVVLCVVGELVGALTDARIATALTIVAAVLATFRRMRAEVRALRAA
jgi:hypothetical protein